MRLFLFFCLTVLSAQAAIVNTSMVGGGDCPTTPSAAKVTRLLIYWAGGTGYLYPNSNLTTGGEITRVDYLYRNPSAGVEVTINSVYTDATFTDGLDVVFSVSWSGCTAGLSFAYSAPAQWKYDRTIENTTLSTLKVVITQKDENGNVVGTSTEYLAPGDSMRAQFTAAAAGTISYAVTTLNSDGTVQETFAQVDGPSSSPWQFTPGAPTPATVINATVPTPTDMTSKTTGNIGFATGALSAKDETLQTGFSALRKAITETGTDTRNQNAQLVNAIAAGTAAQTIGNAKEDTGNALLAAIDQKLETQADERNDAESEANTGAISGWNSTGAGYAATQAGTARGIMSTIGGYFTMAWMPSIEATPTVWEVPMLGNINPRFWQTYETANDIRVYFRGLAQVILVMVMGYRFAKIVSQSYQDVAKATQTGAINAAFGATLPISIPLVLTATAAVYVALGTVVATMWSVMLGSLVMPGSVITTPVLVSELLSITNEWFPLAAILTTAVLLASGTLAIKSAAILASLIRNLIPAS